MNPESVTVRTGCKLEESLKDAKPGDKFQFVRKMCIRDRFTDGVTVVDVQNGGKLVRAADAQPGLDRNRPFCMGEYRIQKGVQHGGVPQHAGAFALGGHGAGGAAEVQVYFGVTQGCLLYTSPFREKALPENPQIFRKCK